MDPFKEAVTTSYCFNFRALDAIKVEELTLKIFRTSELKKIYTRSSLALERKLVPTYNK